MFKHPLLTLKIYLQFIRVPLIFRKNLALFAIGALLMTTLLSAAISFMSGISNQELYLGRQENIIILAQPGASTPVTGSVPIEFKDVLNTITGVEIVSPETLGIGVLSNTKESITYRGITTAFFSIQPTSLTLLPEFGGELGTVTQDQLSRDDFFSLFSKGLIRGAIVGAKLVEDGIINIDNPTTMETAVNAQEKRLSLSATITDARFNLDIVGVFETNTKLDEEILVPMPIAQALNNLPPGRVTLHRIRINPDVVRPRTIERLLTSPISVTLHLNISNVDEFNLEDFSLELIIRTPDGALVARHTVDSKQFPDIPLSLYVGIYEVELRIAGQHSVFTTLIIGNQTEILAGDAEKPLDITWLIEFPFRDYQIHVSWNDHPLSNAIVKLWPLTLEERETLELKTASNGTGVFSNLIQGTYRLQVEYSTTALNTTVRYGTILQLNESNSVISVNGTGSVTVTILNVTTNSVPIDLASYEVEVRLVQGTLLEGKRMLTSVLDMEGENLRTDGSSSIVKTEKLDNNGKAIIYLDPGIYDVYLKKDGESLPDQLQRVVIGDDGFTDVEHLEFRVGTVTLNLTVQPVDSASSLIGHAFNVTLFKQYQNGTLILDRSFVTMLSSEDEPITLEVNAAPSLNWRVILEDLNTSLSNGVTFRALNDTSLELPLAERYTLTFQLKGVYDYVIRDSKFPLEVSNLLPQSVSVEVTNASESSTVLDFHENGTIVVLTTNLWDQLRLTITTRHQINESTYIFSEDVSLDPYSLYKSNQQNQSFIVTYGGILLNYTFQEALTGLIIGAEYSTVSYVMKAENGANVRMTTAFPLDQGKLWGYIPSLGLINYTLSFSSGSEITFRHEYQHSTILKGLYNLELSPIVLKLVDIDGSPIDDSYYEIYQKNTSSAFPNAILQKGYTSSDGEIRLSFFVKDSVTYGIRIKIGSDIQELSLSVNNYVPIIRLEVPIHYTFVGLRNPYKFLSTSKVFIGDVDSYLDEVFEGSILVLQLTIYVMIGMLGILGGFSLLSLISYPLAQHRRHFNIIRVIGGKNTMVALSTSFQLTILAAVMTILGILMGNVSMIVVTKLNPTNIAGLVIEPHFDPLSQLIFFIVITLTVSFASFIYTLQYLNWLSLRGDIKEDAT